MTKTYRVTFTPSGPYFFGSEKTFGYPKQENGNFFSNLYYIRGEKLPSQSALLGALRYLALMSAYEAEPRTGSAYAFAKSREGTAQIGAESFNIDHTGEKQTFGAIGKLSPMFLLRGEEKLIPTPFDHHYGWEREAKKEHEENEKELPQEQKTEFRFFYTPFCQYRKLNRKPGEDGVRFYTAEYDSKAGLADSFVSLADRRIHGSLFDSEVRTGVNLNKKNDGFFKKEYRTLAKGTSFAVYAELDEEVFGSMTDKPQTVMLGQGKTPFSVSFAEHEDDLASDVRKLLTETHDFLEPGLTFVCCLGDALVGTEREESAFAIVQTKDYRAYLTKENGRIEKGGCLHKLIRAGSVFLFEEGTSAEDWAQKTEQQRNAAGIGMNQVIAVTGHCD